MKLHREFDLYFETTNNGEIWPYGCTIEERREKWTPGRGWAEPNLHVIEHDAYLEALSQAEKLAATIESLKYGCDDVKCFCNVSIGDPRLTSHSSHCVKTFETLAEFQKWKDKA